jgi:tetratricopeptide (TPR) repeat protein
VIRSLSALALVVCVALAPGVDGSEVELEGLLERAIEGYADALDTPVGDIRLERFRRAERLFAEVIAAGVENPDLYANTGNASLQAEHLGEAILAYRRALRLDPDHARARQNLDHARALLPEWVPRPQPATLLDTFFFWHRTQSRAERSGLAAFLFAGAAALLAASIILRSGSLRNLAIVPALGWCALLASLALEPASARAEHAVVTAPEAVARAADSVHAQLRFSQPLPEGTELRILEQRVGWMRVGLANGREAWVSASSVSPVDR